MNREIHVRICERLGVQFPGPTRRKDDMDIGNGQEFPLASGDPVVASLALTLGAVSIATTIKGDGRIATAGTLVAMSTECRGTAACDGLEHFAMAPVNPAATVLDEAIALRANDVGHLQRWPGHFFCSLRERCTQSKLETSRVSSGSVMACKC